MLYALEVPHLHGMPLSGTGFANAAVAYDALPDSMKEAIDDLKGVFDFRGRKRSSPVSEQDIAAYPLVKYPIVRRQLHTGRKSLYVVRDDCTSIDRKGENESQALIKALADHIVSAQFIYQPRWEVDDVVVWDNCRPAPRRSRL